MNFPKKDGQDLSGILNYFWQHNRQSYYSFINVSGSGVYESEGQSFDPIHVIDWNSNQYWLHKASNSYIQFCFLRHTVHLTAYDVKTATTDGCRMKEWRIIGSNNASIFDISNQNSLVSSDYDYTKQILNVNFDSKEAYKCYRIQYISTYCDLGFDVQKIDFYGYTYSLEKGEFNSCQQNLFHKQQAFALVLISIFNS